MDKALQIITDVNSEFNIMAFDSNTLSEYNFIKLIDIYFEMQD